MEKLVGRGLGRIVRRVNAKDQQQLFNSVLLQNCNIHSNTLGINTLAQSQRSQSHTLIQVKSHSISTKPNYHPATNLSIPTLNRIFHPVPTSYSYSKLTPNKTTDLTCQQEVIQLLPQVDKMVYYDSGKLGQLVRLRRVREEVNDGGDESLSQLQCKIIGFFNYNQHLACGRYQQYKQYPLTKLLHIATKLIDTHPTEPNPQSETQHFTLLQQLIRERMRNCSLKDYIRLVYVVLAGYSRVYKFGRRFVEGLLIGLKREVGLMEEEDLMRVFWVVSCYSLKGREQWEELWLSERELRQVGDGVYYDRRRSAQYQSRTRVQLQLQILQKVTKRYVNKYLKTQLMLKQAQLIKLTQWLKLVLAFTNHPMTTSNPQQFTKTKNTLICQLLDVVVDRFMGKAAMGKHKRSEVIQLENKSLEFRSIGEVVGFLRVLGLVRDCLVVEGERLVNREGRDQDEKREMVVMGKEWREKGVMVNEVIGVVIKYGNVEVMINELLGIKDNHNNEVKQLGSQQQGSNTTTNIQTPQTQPVSTHQPQPHQPPPPPTPASPLTTFKHLSTQWTLINILTNHYQFNQSTTTPPTTPLLQNWYLKLITQLNITQLLTKTAQCMKQLQRLQLTESVRREMVKMWEIELRVMYGMWNRFYYVRESMGEGGRRQVQGMNFSDMYGQVMGGFTAITTTTTTTINQAKNSYIKHLQPQTILNIITFQLSSTTTPHPGLALVLTYTQQLLVTPNQHIHPTPSYYIRQLQLPIYTYLTRHLTTTTVKQLRSRIQTVVAEIYERNLKAKNYLENYSVGYKEMMNPGGNTFMNNVKLLGLGRGNYVTEGRGNRNGKGLLLGGNAIGDRYDSSNSRQDGSNLGEFILECIIRQKSQYLMSQQITSLNKFFTQIKAFNEITFCHPTTIFSITPMFLFSPKHHQPKALLFLPPSELLQPQLLALKLLYQQHNLQLITLDRHQFLSLHINQRVQMLRKVLNDNNVSNRGQMIKLVEQRVY